ncbi:hypothetical protein CCACVL1_30777 [Corchorus capsularis]|uniref:Uncharacterized protein n=1 Tax=Corchorus capsularis TaxID=210143 RepID=A0A1R3FVL4_COCAP|nr:hypothetical protein CCACVL1_30777 [Corchorus capsularis]
MADSYSSASDCKVLETVIKKNFERFASSSAIAVVDDDDPFS